ncbi:MAG TPA: hypothetical protein VFT45_03990 [Longimicrobium sp.]|nr:hypothetical protein [Longimicrobium sp.]
MREHPPWEAAPPLPLGLALVVGMGCTMFLWERLARRWRTQPGRIAAGAVAALPLFLLLRVSVASIRGWEAGGFIRAAILGLLAGAVGGWYAGTADLHA